MASSIDWSELECRGEEVLVLKAELLCWGMVVVVVVGSGRSQLPDSKLTRLGLFSVCCECDGWVGLGFEVSGCSGCVAGDGTTLGRKQKGRMVLLVLEEVITVVGTAAAVAAAGTEDEVEETTMVFTSFVIAQLVLLLFTASPLGSMMEVK